MVPHEFHMNGRQAQANGVHAPVLSTAHVKGIWVPMPMLAHCLLKWNARAQVEGTRPFCPLLIQVGMQTHAPALTYHFQGMVLRKIRSYT